MELDYPALWRSITMLTDIVGCLEELKTVKLWLSKWKYVGCRSYLSYADTDRLVVCLFTAVNQLTKHLIFNLWNVISCHVFLVLSILLMEDFFFFISCFRISKLMEGLKNSRCFGFGEFPVSVVHLYVMCMFSRLLLLGCLSLYFKDYETCMSRLEIDTFVLVFLLQWKWCLGKEACLCQKRIYMGVSGWAWDHHWATEKSLCLAFLSP